MKVNAGHLLPQFTEEEKVLIKGERERVYNRPESHG